jgi:hypothetical protein
MPCQCPDSEVRKVADPGTANFRIGTLAFQGPITCKPAISRVRCRVSRSWGYGPRRGCGNIGVSRGNGLVGLLGARAHGGVSARSGGEVEGRRRDLNGARMRFSRAAPQSRLCGCRPGNAQTLDRRSSTVIEVRKAPRYFVDRARRAPPGRRPFRRFPDNILWVTGVLSKAEAQCSLRPRLRTPADRDQFEAEVDTVP